MHRIECSTSVYTVWMRWLHGMANTLQKNQAGSGHHDNSSSGNLHSRVTVCSASPLYSCSAVSSASFLGPGSSICTGTLDCDSVVRLTRSCEGMTIKARNSRIWENAGQEILFSRASATLKMDLGLRSHARFYIMCWLCTCRPCIMQLIVILHILYQVQTKWLLLYRLTLNHVWM